MSSDGIVSGKKEEEEEFELVRKFKKCQELDCELAEKAYLEVRNSARTTASHYEKLKLSVDLFWKWKKFDAKEAVVEDGGGES